MCVVDHSYLLIANMTRIVLIHILNRLVMLVNVITCILRLQRLTGDVLFLLVAPLLFSVILQVIAILIVQRHFPWVRQVLLPLLHLIIISFNFNYYSTTQPKKVLHSMSNVLCLTFQPISRTLPLQPLIQPFQPVFLRHHILCHARSKLYNFTLVLLQLQLFTQRNLIWGHQLESIRCISDDRQL